MKKGSHHTEKSRKQMSVNHADFSGENHPNYGKVGYWAGKEGPHKGKFGSDSMHYIDGRTKKWEEIRKQVLERDNNQCQGFRFDPNHVCKGKIDVHHKIPREERPDLIFDLDNLITACSSFHTKSDDAINLEKRRARMSEVKKEFYQTDEGKELAKSSAIKIAEIKYQKLLEKVGIYKIRKFLYGYENKIELDW